MHSVSEFAINEVFHSLFLTNFAVQLVHQMRKDIEKYFDKLFPICRSITGNGLRASFKILNDIIPLQLHEVPTGKKVFDWEIPKEWNIKDAYILAPDEKKICSFKKNNLHVVNYSVPINKEISFAELQKHLYFLPDLPDAIPYVTSYYNENWGFCISHNELKSLNKKGKYKVVIDSELEKGSLTYGDLVLKGERKEEILFSTYLCHPSMANNELSGPLVTAFLYRKIAAMKNRKYSYRFVFAPETIGIIAYLFQHGFYLKENVKAGYVVTCCGTSGKFTYKKSKAENSLADRIAENVLKYSSFEHKIIPFDVGGSDERQYCAPGFNMPVGSLMRTMYKEFKEYHTSLDNKKFISFAALEETVDMYFRMVEALELNETFMSTNPFCEPQLGKRNLYDSKNKSSQKEILDSLFVIAHSDGSADLLDIAEKRNMSILDFKKITLNLLSHQLIKPVNEQYKND